MIKPQTSLQDPLTITKATQLVEVIQRLSLARTLEEIQEIVRGTARSLTGADGATFVLKDHDKCFYADEDAIAPLWKGQRFPLEACISGWSMLNKMPVAIEDIYLDHRIPHDAYRPTFVKSLAMVPIRSIDPIGAIGNYWADKHLPTVDELQILSALADSTAVAMENVRFFEQLEERIEERTNELENALHKLEGEIEQRKLAEAKLEQLSLTDSLTGLNNHRGFYEKALSALELAARHRRSCAIIYCDLDGLKQVNDALGHEVGSQMLFDFAQILRSVFRKTDIIGRIGGDEFVVLAIESSDEISQFKARLEKEIERENRKERPYFISAAIGVSLSINAQEDLRLMMERADEEMYLEKEVHHKGLVRFGPRPSSRHN